MLDSKDSTQIEEPKLKIGCSNCSVKFYLSADTSFTKQKCPECNFEFTVPQQFGKFFLHDIIANDDYSSSHTATDMEKNETFYLRRLNSETAKKEKPASIFKEQAEKLKAISHENIRKIIEIGNIDNVPFYISEYTQGGTLKSTLKVNGDLIPLKNAYEYFEQITNALTLAFIKNLTHGNIKTSNIKFDKDSKVKVSDFGISLKLQQEEWKDKPQKFDFLNASYVAPETIEHFEHTYKSDMFSLGILFYETVTGKQPFTGSSTTELYNSIMNETPVEPKSLRSDLQETVNKLIMDMLNKTPGMRPQKYDQLPKIFKTAIINDAKIQEKSASSTDKKFDSASGFMDPSKTLTPKPSNELNIDILMGIENKKDVTKKIKKPSQETDETVKKIPTLNETVQNPPEKNFRLKKKFPFREIFITLIIITLVIIGLNFKELFGNGLNIIMTEDGYPEIIKGTEDFTTAATNADANKRPKPTDFNFATQEVENYKKFLEESKNIPEMHRLLWISKFKETLIQLTSQNAYAPSAPIFLKSGRPIMGSFKATDTSIEVTSENHSKAVLIQWEDMPLEELISMFSISVGKTSDAEAKAREFIILSIFSLWYGQKENIKTFAEEAKLNAPSAVAYIDALLAK